jgi:predicted permease
VLYFIALPCIYFAKCLNAKKNWKKIIVPIITMSISIMFIVINALQIKVSPYFTLAANTGKLVKSYTVNETVDFDKIPVTLVRMFVFYNIPTWIMLTAYYSNYRKKKDKEKIEKMKIHDLM